MRSTAFSPWLALALAGCSTAADTPPPAPLPPAPPQCVLTLPERPARLARPLPEDARELAKALADKLIEYHAYADTVEAEASRCEGDDE